MGSKKPQYQCDRCQDRGYIWKGTWFKRYRAVCPDCKGRKVHTTPERPSPPPPPPRY